MGLHLARMLGRDYVSVAVTHTDTHVPEMHREAGSPVGFVVRDVDLPEPLPGSIEHALIRAGLRDQVTLTDLRHAPAADDGSALLTEIRTQSAVTSAPLGRAFDAVICTPTVTRDRTVVF
jgi:erythromycin esterase